MFKCADSLENRKPLRIILEFVVFFVVPSVLSGFFYFRINQTLLNQVSNRDRNSKLTKVFRGSWILWVVTWMPSYAMLILTSFVYHNGQYVTFGSFLDPVIVYVMQFVNPIQMLYSHINPIFFMLTIKDFNDCVTRWARRVRNAIICGKTENWVGSKQKTNNDDHKRHAKKIQLSALVLIIRDRSFMLQLC